MLCCQARVLLSGTLSLPLARRYERKDLYSGDYSTRNIKEEFELRSTVISYLLCGLHLGLLVRARYSWIFGLLSTGALVFTGALTGFNTGEAFIVGGVSGGSLWAAQCFIERSLRLSFLRDLALSAALVCNAELAVKERRGDRELLMAPRRAAVAVGAALAADKQTRTTPRLHQGCSTREDAEPRAKGSSPIADSHALSLRRP